MVGFGGVGEGAIGEVELTNAKVRLRLCRAEALLSARDAAQLCYLQRFVRLQAGWGAVGSRRGSSRSPSHHRPYGR